MIRFWLRMYSVPDIVLVVIGGFVLSVVVVRIVAFTAARLGFVDQFNPNTQNRGGAAMGGGIAVVITSLTVTVLVVTVPKNLWHIVIPIATASLLGLVDDLRALHPAVKVLGQGVCVGIYLHMSGATVQGWMIAGPFLILAANAWNVIDVIDGLAGCIGILCLLGAGAVLWMYGGSLGGMSVVAFASAGALAGFLVWNYPPARVLLGDAGSIPLGLLFGLIIVESWSESRSLGVAVALTGAIPFFEVVFLIIERSRKRVPFYRTTPDHFALRMKRHGRSPARILWIVAVYGFVLSALGIVLCMASFDHRLMAGVLTVVLISGVVVFRWLRTLPPEAVAP